MSLPLPVKITSVPLVPWTRSLPAPRTIVGCLPKQVAALALAGASAAIAARAIGIRRVAVFEFMRG